MLAAALPLLTVMGPEAAPVGTTTVNEFAARAESGTETAPPPWPGIVICGAAPKLPPVIVTTALAAP